MQYFRAMQWKNAYRVATFSLCLYSRIHKFKTIFCSPKTSEVRAWAAPAWWLRISCGPGSRPARICRPPRACPWSPGALWRCRKPWARRCVTEAQRRLVHLRIVISLLEHRAQFICASCSVHLCIVLSSLAHCAQFTCALLSAQFACADLWSFRKSVEATFYVCSPTNLKL